MCLPFRLAKKCHKSFVSATFPSHLLFYTCPKNSLVFMLTLCQQFIVIFLHGACWEGCISLLMCFFGEAYAPIFLFRKKCMRKQHYIINQFDQKTHSICRQSFNRLQSMKNEFYSNESDNVMISQYVIFYLILINVKLDGVS